MDAVENNLAELSGVKRYDNCSTIVVAEETLGLLEIFDYGLKHENSYSETLSVLDPLYENVLEILRGFSQKRVIYPESLDCLICIEKHGTLPNAIYNFEDKDGHVIFHSFTHFSSEIKLFHVVMMEYNNGADKYSKLVNSLNEIKEKLSHYHEQEK